MTETDGQVKRQVVTVEIDIRQAGHHLQMARQVALRIVATGTARRCAGMHKFIDAEIKFGVCNVTRWSGRSFANNKHLYSFILA